MSKWRGVLERRRVVTLCAATSAAFLGMAALGQVTQPISDVNVARDYPPPYDEFQPDRALRVFDQTHPKCALWTDWHKLCSRTGPNGSTYCRTDAEHPATASTPFCAKGTEGYGFPPPHLSKAERRSERRYITGYRRVDYSVLTLLNLEDESVPPVNKHKQIPIFDPERPFAGRTLAQLEHPYCAVWMTEKEDGTLGYCAEDGRPGVRSCKEPGIKNRVNYSFPVCVEKIRSRICDPTDIRELSMDVDVVGNVYNVEDTMIDLHPSLPVYGYTCPPYLSMTRTAIP